MLAITPLEVVFGPLKLYIKLLLKTQKGANIFQISIILAILLRYIESEIKTFYLPRTKLPNISFQILSIPFKLTVYESFFLLLKGMKGEWQQCLTP